MTETRYASLSSGLLARKGAAKPAMRPQAFGHVGPTGLEDLGWNDMGHHAESESAPLPDHVPSSIAALTPAPRQVGRPPEAADQPHEEIEAEAEAEAGADIVTEAEAEAEAEVEADARNEDAPEAVPAVAAQHRAIAATFGAEPEDAVPAARPSRKRAEIVSLPRRTGVPGGRKAAFTLRLDAERHLRLRLACAVTGRSAQLLVTAALDAALAEIPEIDALAERVPAAKRN